jgi:hypothetical protein
VQVLVSEQDIDYLLANDYELTRTDDRSIGSAVSAFLSDSVLEGTCQSVGKKPLGRSHAMHAVSNGALFDA